MNILVIGDRRWNDLDTIRLALEPFSHNKDNIVYHKLESGAALVGKVAANQLGMQSKHVTESPEGNDSDIINIDLILCFHNYIYGSKKSLAVITQAKNLNIPYQVIGNKSDA